MISVHFYSAGNHGVPIVGAKPIPAKASDCVLPTLKAPTAIFILIKGTKYTLSTDWREVSAPRGVLTPTPLPTLFARIHPALRRSDSKAGKAGWGGRIVG